MKLYILLLSLFYFIYKSYSQSIYAFTSNQDYTIGQYFFEIDSSNNQIIRNITLYIPCTINGVISVNETNVLLYCESVASEVVEFYLTSINLNSGDYQNLKSIQSSIDYIAKDTQLNYYDNILHLPVAIHSSSKNVSLLNFNFNSNTLNYNTFNSLNYKYMNGIPIGGLDYNSGTMYILYPGENKTSTSTTYPSNIIAFNLNDIKGTQKFFNSIQNINNAYTVLLFCGPQGQLYTVNGNPATSSFDICQVNFQQSTCNNVLSIPVQDSSETFAYLDWYLSGSKQQIIFTSITNNDSSIQFDIYNINDFSHSQLIIDNIWVELSNDYSLTYFYIK